MEQFLRRRRLSDLMDTLGVCVLIFALALMWFVWLWGLCMPSILAGAALGCLGLTARAHYRRRSVARRERALRFRLGGEMWLEDMLLSPAQEAHERAAQLLAQRYRLVRLSAHAEGVLCRQGEETLLVQCVRMPPSGELSASDLAAAQRAVRQHRADRGVVCALGRVPVRIAAAAEQTPVPLRIVTRDTLLALAGRLSPATDAQLVTLGKRRRRHTGSLTALIFRHDKARRYFTYGLIMLTLYILTGAGLYAVTGLTCLTMAVLCRTGRSLPEML